jgi:large subunit ribosomal protein L30
MKINMSVYTGKTVRIVRKRSDIRYSGKQKKTIFALGLRKINASRELYVTPEIAGMLSAVSHMIDVEEVAES